MSSTTPSAGGPPDHIEPLGETLEAPLLGVPLRYSSNSAPVIAVAARALARWRALPRPLIADGPPARVNVIVRPPAPDEPALALEQPIIAQAHGDAFIAAGGGGLMSAQLAAGIATAFVTPALAADEVRLRHHVIERLGLLLAGYRDRAPLPAAAVVRNGRAILLVGATASERAALCDSCLEAGFRLLALDTIYVSLARGLRIWGHPRPLELPAEARWPDQLEASVEQARVCFVERARGQASALAAVPADQALAEISAVCEPAPWQRRDQALAVARALTAGGSHRLSLGADPASAAALFAHLAETGRW